ncbi:esterase/lipase family protein [Rubritalea spongiae]|uniref:Esterase/lipase family protein n=1 Tax=Rubritalea spongiae TaxID=430797 RepID=A0ABW5E207_9BACT
MKFVHLSLFILLVLSVISCAPMMNKVSARTLTEELGRPSTSSERSHHAARSAIYRASTLHKQPEKAIACYLYAVQLLESDDNSWAQQAYQQALGCAIELTEEYELWNRPLRYKNLQYSITHSSESSYTNADAIEKLYYAGRYRSMHLRPTIASHQQGVAMTAHFPQPNTTNHALDPFIPDIGYVFSVSAIPTWTSSHQLNIHLKKSIKHPKSSYNYTIPHTIIEGMTTELIYEGIEGVFRPEKELESIGLYAYEPIDPNRIPVILVHGLAASPNLWVSPTHKLLQDPIVRNNYQFYAFYYPTGLPLAGNAGILKLQIQQLFDYLSKKGAQEKAEQMVVIGHSMGGLLTSLITRDYRGVEKDIYTKNLSDLHSANPTIKAHRVLFEQAPLNCVTRAIFIATPHRGSEYADNWIGQLTSHFIKIPQQLANIDPKYYREDLTSLGRSILNPTGGFDGIQILKFNNPTLEFNLSVPKLPQVTYHSIIGNRGINGNLEKSSDGVVTYSSSHIDEAESEKVVPAWHNAQDNDQAISEMTRILKLHLQ